MRTFGLIGYPLGHSFSQKYFTEKFERENITDAEFKNFSIPDLSPQIFNSLVGEDPTLLGLSVTIPYKESLITVVDAINESVLEIQAINCIHIRDDLNFKGEKAAQYGEYRYTIGYNTDIYGFEKSLLPLLMPHHDKALVLGKGGAAKAVSYVLR